MEVDQQEHEESSRLQDEHDSGSDVDDEEEERDAVEEAKLALVEAAAGEDDDDYRPIPRSRKPRKRKRRALEAHLDGLTAEQREALLASIAQEPAQRHTTRLDYSLAGSRRRGRDSAAAGSAQQSKGDETSDSEADNAGEPEREPTQPREVILERRRLLRTSWRMASFSQFCAAYPHLCVKDFDILLLERDLEGTDEGSYIGEVISRLLYTLTRDSRLAGKEPDKPWLFSLRKEYLKYDPEHNPLGEEPLYPDDELSGQNSVNEAHVKDEPVDATSAAAINGDAESTSASAKAEDDAAPAPTTTTDDTATDPLASMQVDEKDVEPPAPAPVSKGWEDLTLEEKIHALWSICEWQLRNPEKFKTFLTKPPPEDEQVVWRVEPVGQDAENNTYWFFDDNRLWVERETPYKREMRIAREEAQAKYDRKRRARKKRLLREQRQRMRALHERRRLRAEARRIQEEKEAQEMAEIEAKIKAENGEDDGENGSPSEGLPLAADKKKRKRVDEDAAPVTEKAESDPDFEDQGATEPTPSSSRISKARAQDRNGSRASRRRSTRNPSSLNVTASGSSLAAGFDDDEDDWQKIPPEWLKSEDQEKNEDPDFGAERADGTIDGADDDAVYSESDVSLGGDDDEEMAGRGVSRRRSTRTQRGAGRRNAPRRSMRRSPRKERRHSPVKAESESESELSPLSGDEDFDPDASEDDEEEPVEEESGQTYPDAAWQLGPSFDHEHDGLPDDFVPWEAVCIDRADWDAFGARFVASTDPKEKKFYDYLQTHLLPSVIATYDAWDYEKEQRRLAAKAARRKARAEEQKRAEREAAKAAKQAAKKAGAAANAAGNTGAASAAGSDAGSLSRRGSTRIAKNDALLDEELRRKLASEPVNYYADTTRQSSEGALDQRVLEVDRRALRAKQREEEKRAREEAEMMAALGIVPEKPVEAKAASEQMVKQPSGLPSGASQAAASQLDVGVPAVDVNADTASAGALAAAEEEEALPEEFVGEEVEDYFLDCSVCKRRGVNLDPLQKLVQCDTCDRWEHVVCHRKADEKMGRPKRDFDVDDFQCEDCEALGSEAFKVIPQAPKRERSEKQKQGAKKGAEKRRAKMEARRKAKAKAEGSGRGQAAVNGSSPSSSQKKAAAAPRNTKRARQSAANQDQHQPSPGPSVTSQSDLAQAAPQSDFPKALQAGHATTTPQDLPTAVPQQSELTPASRSIDVPVPSLFVNGDVPEGKMENGTHPARSIADPAPTLSTAQHSPSLRNQAEELPAHPQPAQPSIPSSSSLPFNRVQLSNSSMPLNPAGSIPVASSIVSMDIAKSLPMPTSDAAIDPNRTSLDSTGVLAFSSGQQDRPTLEDTTMQDAAQM